MGRERTGGSGAKSPRSTGPAADTGVELRQAHGAVELVEGLGIGPSVPAMAEEAIETRAYGSAMNVARIWLLNKPLVEYAARSMDPDDPFVARAQAVLDRMRPLEAKLPSQPFALGIAELDRRDRDAWLLRLGGELPAAAAPHGDASTGTNLGASDGLARGRTKDRIDLGAVARDLLVPWWLQDDTIRRNILGAAQNPLMDDVDDVLGGLVHDPLYGSGFAVGAASGCGHAVVDCLRGPYDLAKLAIEVGTKLALYKHVELLTSLRDTIKAVPAALELLGERWNDDSDRHAQGKFQGEVVGYIGTQLAILVITAAANPLAELAGPYAAVIRAIAAVGDPLTAVREVALGVRLSEEATAALRAVRRGARAEAAATERAVAHVAEGASSGAGTVAVDGATTSASTGASPTTATASSGGRYGTYGHDESIMDLITDPNPTPEVRRVQEEALQRHANDPNRQLDVAFKALQTLRQGVRARRATEIPAVTRELQAAGLSHVTLGVIDEVHRYLFESAGIIFSYENYAAWSRLATGTGTVDDVRFLVHEISEIRTMKTRGNDFMGDGLTVNTDSHRAWHENVFMPDYDIAHAEALRVEYRFLADQLNALLPDRTPLSAEEVAAFDPTRTEGLIHMLVNGQPLEDCAELPRWAARGRERVTLDDALQSRLGLEKTDVSLAELLVAVKKQPASTSIR